MLNFHASEVLRPEIYKKVLKKHLNTKCKTLFRFTISNAKYQIAFRFVFQMLNAKQVFSEYLIIKIKYFEIKSQIYYYFLFILDCIVHLVLILSLLLITLFFVTN